MAIRPRGSKFQAIVYAGRVDGKDRYTSRTVSTHTEAKKVERQLTATALRSRNGNPASTVAELLDRWMAHASPDLADTTAHTYKGYIENVIKPALGKTRLARLDAGMLDQFYGRLRSEPRANGSPYETASIRQVHAIIRRACQVAVRWGWLGENPAANASPPRAGRHEPQVPQTVQIARFLDGLQFCAWWWRRYDPGLAVFMRLAFIVGARRGELCALKWADLDLERGIVTVRHSLSIPGGGAPKQKDTKSHGVRRLSVGPATVRVLFLHRELEQAKYEDLGARWSEQEWVFTTKPGKPWHPDVASGRYRRAAKDAGLKVRLHDWRHANATASLGAGHPDVQVSHRLGHSSTKMTHDVYSHVTPVGDQAIGETLDALLD